MKTHIPRTLLLVFVSSLFTTFSVGTLAQSSETTLATINGEHITVGDLKPFLPANFDSFAPEKAFAVQRVALDNAIISVILRTEARRRRISVPALRKRMTAGRKSVPDSRVEEEWVKNARYFGLMSPDEAKERLRLDLEAEEQMKIYKSSLARLKAAAKIRVRSDELAEPRVKLNGTGPSKGSPSAPVTITVFSDFQCGYCKASQAILTQVLREYPNDVRLVFRNLPMTAFSGVSPSTAGVCADDQGHFWEFHDAAYASDVLTPERLRAIVGKVGLDASRFDECIASLTTYRAVTKDVDEARRLGITGTPTFVVNGKVYKGMLGLSEFREVIEHEVKSSSRRQGH